MTAEDVAVELSHLQRRCVQEAVQAVHPSMLRRRAALLRWAQPQAGDFHGNATREELSKRWRALEEAARACENRATLLEAGDIT